MNWLNTLIANATSPQEQRRMADEIAGTLVQEARRALADEGNVNPTGDEVNRRAESLYLANAERLHHGTLESIEIHSAIARQSMEQRR
jgi:hypothetical protein